MARIRFESAQIIEFIRLYEAGASIKSLRERYGFSYTAFHNWRIKFGEFSSVKKMENSELALENMRLKELLTQTQNELQATKYALKCLMGVNS